jgi:ABC-type nickel/cobalt efflux system permease component RcnA
VAAGLGLAAAALWGAGAVEALTAEALALQRAMQDGLARGVLAIRRGEPGAFGALTGAAFLYGVAHAAGPGHGKALLGAAAVGSRATATRLAGLALAAAAGQGLTAVVLVYGALGLLAAPAADAIGLGERGLAPLAWGVAGLIGLGLVLRGLGALLRPDPAPGGAAQAGSRAHDHDHDHDHDRDDRHDAACGCGHDHGPTVAQVEALRGWRDAAALVGAIALRPCMGAMMTLAVAWGVGLPGAGLAAVAAMALGVALVTGAVALGAMGARETALAASGAARLATVAAALPIAAGAALGLTAAAGLAAAL